MHIVPPKYIDIKDSDVHYPLLKLYFRFYSVGSLLLKVIRGKKHWERRYFWLDNFVIPYNKLIGCKIRKHEWFYMDDEEEAFCINCHKRSGHIPLAIWDRNEKLKKIKKGIKK